MSLFYVFIVGSPRSGTTLTGDILNCHPKIATWFVPYFMWERHFRHRPDDVLTASDATPKIAADIRSEFTYFRKKTGAQYVVDQSPRNSLRVPFIREIFPEARFIHVKREYKDAILSINKEWKKRMDVYRPRGKNTAFDFTKIRGPLQTLIGRQPLMKHKLQSILFELQGIGLKPESHYNRRRWNGRVGWGPRIPGWEQLLDNFSMLAVNAYQWKGCVTAVENSLPTDSERTFHLSYENLLDQPENAISEMLSYIDNTFQYNDLKNVPRLMKNNYHKWETAFSREEIRLIEEIINA